MASKIATPLRAKPTIPIGTQDGRSAGRGTAGRVRRMSWLRMLFGIAIVSPGRRIPRDREAAGGMLRQVVRPHHPVVPLDGDLELPVGASRPSPAATGFSAGIQKPSWIQSPEAKAPGASGEKRVRQDIR